MEKDKQAEQELWDDYENDGCERCGCCDTYWESCYQCGGEGGTDGEDLMMEDPLWYGPDDFRTCDLCEGKGGWWVCLGHCDENGKHSNHYEMNITQPPDR